MTVPDNTALDATTGVSISVWVKVFALTTTSSGIFSKATAAGGTGAATCGDYSLFVDNSNVYFGVNGSAACSWGALATQARSIQTNTWHHIVGSYSTSQGTAKIYVDNVLRGTSAAYTTNLNNTGTIGVAGAWFDKGTATRCWNGYIDDLRIYKNYALTAADVAALYNGGRGEFALNTVGANETVVWRFDEGTGTTATDAVSSLVLTSGATIPVEWGMGIIPDR